jgi:hypothetical protein
VWNVRETGVSDKSPSVRTGSDGVYDARHIMPTSDVMNPYHVRSEADGHSARGERGAISVLDVSPSDLAEKAFAAGADQNRPTHRDELR